jgi:hypothetical protein
LSYPAEISCDAVVRSGEALLLERPKGIKCGIPLEYPTLVIFTFIAQAQVREDKIKRFLHDGNQRLPLITRCMHSTPKITEKASQSFPNFGLVMHHQDLVHCHTPLLYFLQSVRNQRGGVSAGSPRAGRKWGSGQVVCRQPSKTKPIK